MRRPLLYVLLVLLCTGCAGHLVESLNKRHVQSCVFWHGFGGFTRGVTATGGVDIEHCLARLGVTP